MTVVNPADSNRRLVIGGENVSGLVRELVAGRKNGDAGAVAGGCAAVAAEHDCLELAIGRDGLNQIVVAAGAREKEVDEKSEAANRQDQDGTENEKRPLLGWFFEVFIHGRCEESPNS